LFCSWRFWRKLSLKEWGEMPIPVGAISSIIQGSVNLSGQFLQFGAQMAAIKNQPLPKASTNNFTIELPGTGGTKLDVNVMILAAVIVMMLMAAIFITIKFFYKSISQLI
jgi:hypothetical protein